MTNDAPPTAATAGGNAVGAHQSHVTNGNIKNALACTECHASVTAMNHANGTVNTSFTTTLSTGTAWNPATPATSNCATSYRHGAAASQSTWGAARATPLWNTAANGVYQSCDACHGSPPPLNATTHHPQNTTNPCSDCHGAGYATTGITGTALNTHVDKTVQFDAGCTGCHGDSTAANVASTDNRSAPGFNASAVDITGALTGSRVGAHKAHLVNTTLKPSGAVTCNQCHTVPTDDVHSDGAGNATGARAGITWGTLANGTVSGGANTNPAFASGTCSNTYCHGGKWVGNATYVGTRAAPLWTDTAAVATACNSCHLSPPTSVAHSSVTSTKNCGDCHTGYSCTSGNLAACTVAATHLNGTYEPANVSCTTCHGTAGRPTVALGVVDALEDAAPPLDAQGQTGTNHVGPHAAHTNPTSATQIAKPILCAECHGTAVNTYTSSHYNGTINVTFANATGANLRLYPAGQAPGNPWSCNTYCHDNAATNGSGGSVAGWTWNTTTVATCASCHGSPPTGPAHVSVGTAQPATACNPCHNTTVNASGAIIFTGSGATLATPHMNGLADTGGVTCHSCHGTNGVNDAPPTASTSSGNAVGAHQSHMTTGNIANALTCNGCHTAVGATAYNHANGTVGMSFTGAGSGTIWNPATPATSNCSTSWCHGGAASQSTWGRASPNPLWNTVNGSFQQCNSCHGSPPPIATHHPNNTISACSACHGTGYATTGITGATALANHVNGTVEPRTGCTACHGDLSVSGATNTAAAAAPGYNGVGVDSHGNMAVTVRTVGAHDAHVRGTSFRLASIGCGECHAGKVPVNLDVNHADGTVAALAGGTLALTTVVGNAAGTGQSLTWSGTTCANTYCHGNFRNGKNVTMTWAQSTTLDCNSCHGRGTGATPTAPGGTHQNRTDCVTCHPDYTVAANRGTHMDGQITYQPGLSGCSLCHSAPPPVSVGGHPQNPTCQSCHGAGYTPPSFGIEPTTHQDGTTIAGVDKPANGCTGCHGQLANYNGTTVTTATATAAPGYNDLGVDTVGSTTTSNRGVGAHDGHVRKTNLRSAALPCTECHSGFVPTYPDIAHADGTAATAFGTLAKTGTVNPAWNGSTCSATYCHGNFTNGNDQIGGGTPTTPAQVTGLSSPSQTNRSITLSWTAVTGALLYKVERGTSRHGPVGADRDQHQHRLRGRRSLGRHHLLVSRPRLEQGHDRRRHVLCRAHAGDHRRQRRQPDGHRHTTGSGRRPDRSMDSRRTCRRHLRWRDVRNLPTAAAVTTMSTAANTCVQRLYTTAAVPSRSAILTVVLTHAVRGRHGHLRAVAHLERESQHHDDTHDRHPAGIRERRGVHRVRYGGPDGR